LDGYVRLAVHTLSDYRIHANREAHERERQPGNKAKKKPAALPQRVSVLLSESLTGQASY
jgi:hypothetical protein